MSEGKSQKTRLKRPLVGRKLREREEVATRPNDEKQEIYDIMWKYGVDREAASPLVEMLASNQELWIQVRLPQCHSMLLVTNQNDSL